MLMIGLLKSLCLINGRNVRSFLHIKVSVKLFELVLDGFKMVQIRSGLTDHSNRGLSGELWGSNMFVFTKRGSVNLMDVSGLSNAT